MQGWFDGEEECSPPEPDKRWLEIIDIGPPPHVDSDVMCVLVQRKRQPVDPELGPVGVRDYLEEDAQDREEKAQLIAEALNLHAAGKEA